MCMAAQAPLGAEEGPATVVAACSPSPHSHDYKVEQGGAWLQSRGEHGYISGGCMTTKQGGAWLQGRGVHGYNSKSI